MADRRKQPSHCGEAAGGPQAGLPQNRDPHRGSWPINPDCFIAGVFPGERGGGGGCSLSPTVREPHCKVVCDTIPVSEGQEENHQRPTSCDSDHSHIGSSKGTSVRMGG